MGYVGTIYVLKNKINEKRYVGQTVRPLETRLDEHFEAAYDGSEYPIHCAIRKYGWESFSVVSGEIPVDQLDFFEQKVIAHYNTFGSGGYNATTGGGVGSRRIPTEDIERIQSLWSAGQCLRDIVLTTGRHLTTVKSVLVQLGEDIDRVSPIFRCSAIEVVRIEPSTKRMNLFPSVMEAARSVGFSATALTRAIEAVRIWQGYFWKYSADVVDELENGAYSGVIPEPCNLAPDKEVAKIDLSTGEILRYFSTATEASRELLMNRSAVSNSIGTNRPCGGFYYRYTTQLKAEEINQGIFLGEIPEIMSMGSKRQLDYDKIVELWRLHKDAEYVANIMGCNNSIVTRALRYAGISDYEQRMESVSSLRRKVVQLDPETGVEIARFPSASSASCALGFDRASVSAAIRRNDGRCGGYLWKYLD